MLALCWLSLLQCSPMTMQTVFWQQMTTDLNVTFSQLNAGLSFNVAGLAVGSLLFIPLTKKYGRRLTYVISTGVLAGVSWWSARMSTLSEMYLTNLLFGLAGSTNEAISEMTVRWPQETDAAFHASSSQY
ncbi:major facilitator superfamily domain-containing protein [Purpureocillium lilacinum]|uniref:Major facilitator superfamily domain-containing protein n=1 Tax=Purpureocillium lilacinum TaxID=33203 RepID=A0A179I083_PURLI|nr:major facilitator superfamily domain-containing protein [Purpureocillium lilacinum]OAQ95572.1 major facilitator superfamily domain-containing protein [Purpureocillium lilacinum]